MPPQENSLINDAYYTSEKLYQTLQVGLNNSAVLALFNPLLGV